jgi:hypothetical protein
MKLQSSIFRNSLFLLAVFLALPAFRAAAQSNPDAASAQEKQSTQQSGLKPLPRDPARMEELQEGPEFLRRRHDWFFQPRAFPLGFIPHGARERALQQKTQMSQREGRLNSFGAPLESAFLPPPTGTSSAWMSVGPQPTSSPFNPPFTSGRVTALAVNPNNASNVYLGGADGGLWISTDGGGTWNPLTDNPPNAANIPTVAVGAIAVDPTLCGAAPSGICTTVYVGTGEGNFAGDNVYGEGVLNCTVTAGTPPTAACTQDSTFHSPAPLDNTRGGPMIGALAVNRVPTSNNILLAGVEGIGSALVSGVWCSADKGATWTRVLPTTLTNGSGDTGTDVAFASDGTAWAALGFPFGATGNGIYKSTAPVTSCTISWAQQTLPSSFTAANIGRITLALAPSSNTTIYAAIADATTTSSNLLGVVRSINATAATPTWTQLTDPLVSAATGFCTGQCFFDMALGVDPVNPAVVYAGGSGQNPIIRTTTGTTTATFADVTTAGSTNPHVDTHVFAFAADGSKVWVGNDGGIWSSGSPAGALSWSNLNGPAATSTGALNLTQFYPGISIHPSNPGFAMGGTQDNGTQVDQAFTGALALRWQDAGVPCDGGFTVIDSKIPSTTYGECEYLPSTILFILASFAGDGLLGNGFLAVTGINPADRGSFIPPLVGDPVNTQTLYFGTCRVWQTKDGANTWTAISPDVTTATHPAGCAAGGANLSTIAVAPSNPNTIYVGSDQGHIEVTANGGTSWTSIVTATLPARAITQIAVDPSNSSGDIAYATFSGFGTCATFCSGPTGHVFKTVNGTSGAPAWVDVSGTATKLPDIPVNALVIDPNDPMHNTLFVGTDIGAFFTTDGGVNWSPLGAASSMPNAQILSLALHNPSRTLRAATHGRGMWDLNLGGAGAFSIASISPFTANAGAASITNFTVNGSGFIASNSVVNFAVNGTTTPLTTSCAATSCTATIPAAQLQSGGAASITVTNTSPAGTTNALPFTILNPVPAIVSISPTTTATGTTNFSLTANGSSIICGGPNATIVLFNQSPRSNITACSATSITVKLPDTDLSLAGVFAIDLSTPQPGGGPDINPAPPALTITQSNNPVPTITTLVPSGATAGGPAFTLTVNGTNFVGTSVVNFAGTARSTTFVSATQLTAPITAADIASAGTPAVTVTNPAPGGGTSNSVTFPVTSPGSFTVAGAAATVTAGSSGNSAITVTPSGGFTGAVAITCGATVPGVTCSALNVTVPSGGGNGTGNLAITVAAPSAAGATALVMPQKRHVYAAGMIPTRGGRGWWMLSAGTGLAAIILLFLPGQKRYRAALALGLVCVLSFTFGCGGYSGGSGGGGPVATVTHITAMNPTKAAAGATFTFTATVTGGTPTDMVQLLDGGVATGAAVAVSGGTATLTTAALSTVGTHAITAHYAGDATNTVASSSGALNVTVTGPTMVTIGASPAASNGTAAISLTIN